MGERNEQEYSQDKVYSIKVSQCESVNQEMVITYNPLVSIITAILNDVKYLEECIQSVSNQSYPYIEHIIADGGSTDGTVDILSRYQAKYPDRVRFISEPDKGSGDATNKAFRMARGQIIGVIGSDDMYEPGAIQIVVEFFRANPDAYFVFGGCNHINEKGEVIARFPNTRDFNLDEIIKVGCYVPTTSSFYRREVVEKVGVFDA